MAVSPDPRTLLLPDDSIIPSFLNDKGIPMFASGVGLLSVFVLRMVSRRPLFSGIQSHLLAGVGGAILGKYGKDHYDEYNMERDAVLRHYIELHPEDFPPPERIRVGEVFKAWHPVR